MKSTALIGIVLVVLGGLALAYQGITYTRNKNVVDLGPLQVKTEYHERIPLPPIFGGLALAGGVVVLIVGTKGKA
jgi:hypothetical protein